MIGTRLAIAASAAICAAGLAFAPVAFAASPTVPACPADVLAPHGECLVQVTTEDGVHAGVRLPDVLCVRVDALDEPQIADARVAIPCPPHGFRDCVEAAEHGYHDIPARSEHYRKWLDSDNDGVACETGPPVVVPLPVPEAPAPSVVRASLPVTH